MADTDYLPRRVQNAWSRAAVPESVKAMLLLHGNPEYFSMWDDFFGDALDAKYPADGGTGTQAPAISANADNGVFGLTTQGNQATDSCVLTTNRHWDGDRGIYFATRINVSTIADIKFSVGLGDEQTDTGPINSKASATFNISDFVGISYDTADDALLTVQSNGGTTDLNLDSDPAFTVVGGEWFVLEIVVKGNHASVFINGTQRGGGAEVVEGGVNLGPVWYVEQNAASAVTLEIDWWFCTGPRT